MPNGVTRPQWIDFLCYINSFYAGDILDLGVDTMPADALLLQSPEDNQAQ